MSRSAFPWTDGLADQLTGILPYVPGTVEGGAVYRVPLNNRPETFATLDKAGYDFLVARGVDFLIGANTGGQAVYVQAQRPGTLHRWDTVARLLANPSKGQWVRYANLDQTDLRLSNLVLYRPKAKAA